ncbi:MAG: hypothetical protein ACPGLV_13680 [Bacteroidia bacterium]
MRIRPDTSFRAKLLLNDLFSTYFASREVSGLFAKDNKYDKNPLP